LFAAILLVVAVGLFWWSRYHQPEAQSAYPVPTQQEPATSAASPPTAAAAATPSPGNLPAATSTASSTKPQTRNPAKQAYAGMKQASMTCTTKQAGSTTSGSTGEFSLVVHADEDCWISITVDGQPASIETLSLGNQRVIHGRNEVIIKAGNIGALDF